MDNTDALQQEYKELQQQIIIGENNNSDLAKKLIELNKQVEAKQLFDEHDRLVENKRNEAEREALKERKKLFDDANIIKKGRK